MALTRQPMRLACGFLTDLMAIAARLSV